MRPEKDDLYAGRTPVRADGLTIRVLLNEYLKFKEDLVAAGELEQATAQVKGVEMKIPKFWSKGTAEGKTRDGRATDFSCWRSSDISEVDARESAMATAKRVLDALLSGRKLDRYAYGCVPLREEVLNKVEDGQGNTIAVVTRNLYGSLVLNAERVMFVDVDFPPVGTGEAAKHFFARLLGRAKKPPEVEREEKARAGVEQFVAANPSN